MSENPPPHDDNTPRKHKKKKIHRPEVFFHLDRISAAFPQALLLVDVAKEAAADEHRKLYTQISNQARHLRRSREKRDSFQQRLVELLDGLLICAVSLPRPVGKPPVLHEQLLETFRQLKTHDFLTLAQVLHHRTARSNVPDYQRFLVDEVLIKGARLMAEHLVRYLSKHETAMEYESFVDRLKDYIAGEVNGELKRLVDYTVTPEVGQQLDVLLRKVMHFLGDMLTASPAVRLLVGMRGEAYDPRKHQTAYGRPEGEGAVIRATLFPGYAVLGNPKQLVEKAQVYTVVAEEVEDEDGE